ncbi:expressed protein [Echinococcus multilocularis]|uniref:Expressed protein n=1 Tax=Echinococcus multilocularis TaxID=6211 RepID=A0A068YEK0_ECHMU|nr:expressed protein [Echinococcus multilocularis]
MHKTTSGLPILSRIKFNLCIFSANLAKIEITYVLDETFMALNENGQINIEHRKQCPFQSRTKRPDSASAATQEAAIGQATSGGLYTAIWRSAGCVRP